MSAERPKSTRTLRQRIGQHSRQLLSRLRAIRMRSQEPPLHFRVASERLAPAGEHEAVDARQRLLKGFDPEALAACHILMIGAGGLGGEMAEGLVRKGLGHITIIEHDIVEITNLNRQHFFARDLYQPKAFALARNLLDHAVCGTTFDAYRLRYQDALAMDLLPDPNDVTLVYCGVDNNWTRVEVSIWCRLNRIPLLVTGVDEACESGYCFIQVPGEACFGCLFNGRIEFRRAPCASPAAKDILKVVTGYALFGVDSLLMPGRRRNWNYRFTRLAAWGPDKIRVVPIDPNCPLCGANAADMPTLTPDCTEHG